MHREHGARQQEKDTRTQKALSTSGFVNVDCVAGCVCGNMHAQLRRRSHPSSLTLQALPRCVQLTSDLNTALALTVRVSLSASLPMHTTSVLEPTALPMLRFGSINSVEHAPAAPAVPRCADPSLIDNCFYYLKQ